MSYGWSEFLKSVLATLALPCFFIAPGYLAGTLTNVFGFRKLSLVERMLWALVLSLPLALEIAVHPGVPLKPGATLLLFVVIALIGGALFVRDAVGAWRTSRCPVSREAIVCLLCAAALALYCLGAAAPIEVRHGLYESAAWQDWNLRIQLVNECLRAGNHPGNPMFAIHGVPAMGRYYYYWYVLCAQLALLTGAGARASLTGSCVAAAMSLVASIFLTLKYLRLSAYPLRKQCQAALLTACVIGLDIIPTVIRLFGHRRLNSDPQFWLDDRSPSWLHLLLWSPHHVGGVVCCMTGTLLIVYCRGRSFRQQAAHVVLASLCFGAAAGASTFIMGLFAVVGLMIFADAAIRREWPTVVGYLVAGVISLVITMPLFHVMLRKSSAPPQSAAAKQALKDEEALDAVPGDPVWAWYLKQPVHKPDTAIHSPLTITVRYRDESRAILRYYFQFQDVMLSWQAGHAWPAPGLLQRGLRPLVMVVLFLFDFGFFLFVFVYRLRCDVRQRGELSRQLRIWWLILLGVGIPGFFLTSSSVQPNNDLGRHAGLCLRFILLIAAAPLVAEYLDRRRAPDAVPFWKTSWVQRLAVATFVLGLVGQVWQIGINRLELPLVDAGKVPAFAVASRVPRIGMRFEEIRKAMDAATHATAAEQIVQPNPHSRLGPIYLLYTSRRMAAADDGCNVPFGGTAEQCNPLTRQLVELYGGTGAPFQGEQMMLRKMRFRPEMVTVANFGRVCQDQNITLMVATYSDPVWRHPESWVWQLPAVYANGTSRVIACPVNPAAGG